MVVEWENAESENMIITKLHPPTRSCLSESMPDELLNENFIEFRKIYQESLSKKLDDLTDSEKATIAIMNGREWEVVSGGMIGIVKAKPIIPIERLIFKKVKGEWQVTGVREFTYPRM